MDQNFKFSINIVSTQFEVPMCPFDEETLHLHFQIVYNYNMKYIDLLM